MNTIKYPIKEVNIKTIPQNRLLKIGISQNQKALCEKNIKQFGLVMPIVTVEDPSGQLMVLKGENELSILREMNFEKADVFITSIQSKSDIGKAILLLSSLHNELNHISEGLVLKEIIKSGQYNQKQLALQLMKSPSWISKRLSLVEQLNDNVTDMVLSKKICPATAQNIARIPKRYQFVFASKVYSNSIPKAKVEKLVSTYSNKNTPEALKEEIISNPLLAFDKIFFADIKKTYSKVKPDLKFENSLRLMLKLISDMEEFFAQHNKENEFKYSSLIHALQVSLSRFVKLLQHEAFSPGKLEETSILTNEGGINSGNN